MRDERISVLTQQLHWLNRARRSETHCICVECCAAGDEGLVTRKIRSRATLIVQRRGEYCADTREQRRLRHLMSLSNRAPTC